jgi:hypothetical protein
VRRDGFTVRATAIADARPAMQVGLPQTNPAQLGVTPFLLSDVFVAALPVAGRQVTINPLNGLICAGLNCNGVVAGNAAGRFIDNLLDPTRARWRAMSRVGAAILPPLPVNCAIANTFAGYGPVYSTMASGAVRVIGFTRITLARDPARLNNVCAAVLTRAAVSRVAPSNASAVASNGLPLPANVGAAEVVQLINKNRARNGNVNYVPVLAPVLAR